MTSIRNSVHDLHDESIHLQTALSDLQKEASDLTVSLHYKMQTEPPKEFKYAILAITKEALTNTRRHSNAERFDIHLTEHHFKRQWHYDFKGFFRRDRTRKYAGTGKAIRR